MNDLQKLNFPCIKVDKNCSSSTEWVNVSKYKCLRITVYSEGVGVLNVIFSVDGVENGITQTFKVSKKWDTYKLEVLCNYVRFNFVNGPEDNNKLLINVLGRYSFFSGMIEKSVRMAEKPTRELKLDDEKPFEPKSFDKVVVDDTKIEELIIKPDEANQPILKPEEGKQPVERGKSPFRKFMERKKPVINPSNKVDCYDPRLPNLILRGNMIVATQTNQFGIIPPPHDNQDYVLCWSGGMPNWKTVAELGEKWKF